MLFNVFLAEYRRRALIKEQAISSSSIAISANADSGKSDCYFFYSETINTILT